MTNVVIYHSAMQVVFFSFKNHFSSVGVTFTCTPFVKPSEKPGSYVQKCMISVLCPSWLWTPCAVCCQWSLSIKISSSLHIKREWTDMLLLKNRKKWHFFYEIQNLNYHQVNVTVTTYIVKLCTRNFRSQIIYKRSHPYYLDTFHLWRLSFECYCSTHTHTLHMQYIHIHVSSWYSR